MGLNHIGFLRLFEISRDVHKSRPPRTKVTSCTKIKICKEDTNSSKCNNLHSLTFLTLDIGSAKNMDKRFV